MFPYIFRIGPMLIAELIFLAFGASALITNKIYPCIGYTFIELSMQLFLLEVTIALRLIKKSKELRVKYVAALVFGRKKSLLLRTAWNSFFIVGIVLGLTFWMIKEGFTLSDEQMSNEQKEYTLYPMCYFSVLANHPESGK
jgi:hypothetical protein